MLSVWDFFGLQYFIPYIFNELYYTNGNYVRLLEPLAVTGITVSVKLKLVKEIISILNLFYRVVNYTCDDDELSYEESIRTLVLCVICFPDVQKKFCCIF